MKVKVRNLTQRLHSLNCPREELATSAPPSLTGRAWLGSVERTFIVFIVCPHLDLYRDNT